MRKKIVAKDDRLLTDIMQSEGLSYQDVAKKLDITRQAARQQIQKQIGHMRVSSLIRITEQLGHHIEIVKDEEGENGR